MTELGQVSVLRLSDKSNLILFLKNVKLIVDNLLNYIFTQWVRDATGFQQLINHQIIIEAWDINVRGI